LEFKQILLRGGDRIDTVYFPDTAVVSLLTTMDDGTTVEVANIGNEGIVGLPAFLGIETLGPRECYQSRSPVRPEPSTSPPSPRLPLGSHCGDWSRVQSRPCSSKPPSVWPASPSTPSRNGAAAGYSSPTTEWVTASFPLTQDFLAQVLGVRRASVTVAARALQNAGLISYSRGRVTVLDREGLEGAACECYRIIRSETDRLLLLPRPPIGH
jgi:hypothetical protein